MILLLFWKQQGADAGTATITGHNKAALIGRAIIKSSCDSPVLGSLNIVDCLTPLLQHNKMAKQRSAHPCFTPSCTTT